MSYAQGIVSSRAWRQGPAPCSTAAIGWIQTGAKESGGSQTSSGPPGSMPSDADRTGRGAAVRSPPWLHQGTRALSLLSELRVGLSGPPGASRSSMAPPQPSCLPWVMTFGEQWALPGSWDPPTSFSLPLGRSQLLCGRGSGQLSPHPPLPPLPPHPAHTLGQRCRRLLLRDPLGALCRVTDGLGVPMSACRSLSLSDSLPDVLPACLPSVCLASPCLLSVHPCAAHRSLPHDDPLLSVYDLSGT